MEVKNNKNVTSRRAVTLSFSSDFHRCSGHITGDDGDGAFCMLPWSATQARSLHLHATHALSTRYSRGTALFEVRIV
jgi:hypothetical protein